MVLCSQLALLVAASLASTPASSAESALAPEPAANYVEPALDPLAQGTHGKDPPRWFVAVSGNVIQSDFIGPLGDDSDQISAFGVDFGYTNWDNELGITIEGGYLGSTLKVPVSSLSDDDVQSHRLLVGLRLMDRGSSWWMPYLRGGYMWRMDDGDTVSDDGSGFYVGGGFDFFLGRNLRLGPQLLYTESESLDAKEWVLGAVLSFGF